MKPLSERSKFKACNGWGQPTTSERQSFIVEQKDVGSIKQHHRGYNYSTHQFTRADVGRRIEQCWYSGWTSWVFCI